MVRFYFYITALFLFFLSTGIAKADTGFYGVFDFSAQKYISPANQEGLYFKSNGSRAGVKKQYNINEDTAWLLQIESAIDYDSSLGEQTYLSTRNIFIGLEGHWGRVIVGKNDSPLKMSQGNIDLFTDTDVQIYSLHEGDNRVSDTIIFNSKSLNGLSINYGIVKNDSKDFNSLGHSLSIQHRADYSYFAIAYDNSILNHNIFRLTSELEYEQFNFGLLWQKTNEKNKDTTYGHLFSMQYSLSEYLLKFQYSRSDDKIEGGTLFTVGTEWLANDQAALYVLLSEKSGNTMVQEKLMSLGIKYRFK